MLNKAVKNYIKKKEHQKMKVPKETKPIISDCIRPREWEVAYIEAKNGKKDWKLS